MTEYVLEILDGDRASEIIALGEEPVTFGRRPGNTVVLNDEKVSGKHATILREEGQWVLRDLDSTNGTLMEGRRVSEVVLTPNDVIQFGRIRVAFKAAGAPTPTGSADMAIRRVDRAEMSRSGRRGGVGLLLVLILLLGGGAAWLFFGQGKAGGPGQTTSRVPVVPGNRLPAGVGDFESEATEAADEDGGWELQVAGAGFSRVGGAGRSHTGRHCLEARFTRPETGTPSYVALARTAAEIAVGSGEKLSAQAQLRTEGEGRAALRMRFWSSSAAEPAVMCSGSVPAPFPEGYQAVRLDLEVPAGCDRVAVELLALLPGEDAAVRVDDVALIQGGEGTASSLQTPVGQRLVRSGAGVVLRDSQRLILTGIRPIVTDPGLLELDAAGLLCLADAGTELSVTQEDERLVLGFSGPAHSGVRLDFSADTVAAGVLTRAGDAHFESRDATFRIEPVDQILLGYQTSRLLIQRGKVGSMQGAVEGSRFTLTLPAAEQVALVFQFAADRQKANELLAQARTRQRDKDAKGVLAAVQEVLQAYPHDDQLAGEAAAVRTRVRDELAERLRELEAELDKAAVYGSLRGYQRLQRELTTVIDQYGIEHVLQPEKVQAMQQRVTDAIAAIEAEKGQEDRAKLEVLLAVYERSASATDKQLASLIRDYLNRNLQKAK